MSFRHLIFVLLAVLSLAGPAFAQAGDPFVIKRATELRSGPSDASASLGTLAAQTPVTHQATRQGPWYEVRTAQGATGWVHMFDMGNAAPAGNVVTGTLRGLSNFFSRGGSQANTNSSGTTSTVGIRGLGAEDIARSQPNLTAVAQLDRLRSDPGQARKFAQDARLAAQSVDALPVPAAPKNNTAATPEFKP